MVNTANPFGFRQFGQREGTAPTAGMERFFISSGDTNLYFTGDAVTASSANGSLITVPSSVQGTINGQAILGVFQGCEYYSPSQNRITWSSFWPGAASTGNATAYVCTNPEQLYLVQGTSGAVLTSTSVGMGYYHTLLQSSLGSQLSGVSAMSLQSSQPTGLSSNALYRVVDLYQNCAPPGVNGTSTGAEGLQIAVVQIQNLVRRTGAGTNLVYPTT